MSQSNNAEKAVERQRSISSSTAANTAETSLKAEVYKLKEEVEGDNGRSIEERATPLQKLRNIFDNIVLNYSPCEERDKVLVEIANILLDLGDVKFVDKRKNEANELRMLPDRALSIETDESDHESEANIIDSIDQSAAELEESIDESAADTEASTEIMVVEDRSTKSTTKVASPGIKSEDYEGPFPTEFPGCFKWEGRWWLPPFGPGHPVSNQINPGNPPYGYGYIASPNGTSFQPFSREAALEEHFRRFPIQDSEKLLEAYRNKHQQHLTPFDHGDDTDDKVLVCNCLTYPDDRQYIQCDNTYHCLKQFYHPECLGMPAHLIPTNEDKWFCPECLREGRGGAKDIAKMVGFYARYTFNKVVADPNPERYIKPWTADALKSARPEVLRDLGLSTFEEAKNTLLERSAQKVGRPVPSTPTQAIPMVVNGTVVKQPNKFSWTTEEDLILVEVMRELYNEGLVGQPLWDQCEIRLKARGCDRVMGAARNRWMRGLREEYNLDERRKKNANKMTTAIQVGKSERDPESVKKNNARYTVSRKAEAPAGHVQARAAAAAATGANAVAVGRPPMSAPPRISAYGRGSQQDALGLNDMYLGRGYSDDDGSETMEWRWTSMMLRWATMSMMEATLPSWAVRLLLFVVAVSVVVPRLPVQAASRGQIAWVAICWLVVMDNGWRWLENRPGEASGKIRCLKSGLSLTFGKMPPGGLPASKTGYQHEDRIR
ncbi:uncharacterized protein AB675_3497 [Cyphellophora attinorum]|uniref:Myb-like domain-containing protein n=1 Tax=Cyphellophora attinorum TaxID=1664694 RepID=A0A0N1P0C7_9EURO|nr:uncharacterized protein AB675_3497 [Phialophora attinorum]KPI39780.1 hypothetical protein AB675_3497 [Phialophora attinorum]